MHSEMAHSNVAETALRVNTNHRSRMLCPLPQQQKHKMSKQKNGGDMVVQDSQTQKGNTQ